MSDIGPWLVTSGLCCVVPILAFVGGIWFGRNAIRLRSPFYRKTQGEVVGYK